MAGERRRMLWGIKDLLGEKTEIKIKGLWHMMILRHISIYLFFFLSLSKWQEHQELHYVTVKILRPLQKGLYRGLLQILTSFCASSLRCQEKAYSITAIPECALAATKPSQKRGQPAPCGWQPWGPLRPWGVHWTHSVRPT